MKKFLRIIFGCISLTAVAFVFQACPESDPYYDIRLTGTVKSKTTNLPIKGIKVTVSDVYDGQYGLGFTDEDGKFDFYARVPNEDNTYYKYDSVYVYFLDIDGTRNGYFKDRTFVITPAHKDEVRIHVELEQK
jgi:hypothetical protein